MTDLHITGPNGDGEYWLHIKAGGKMGGINLGSEHGPLAHRLLDAASIEAPVQEPTQPDETAAPPALLAERDEYRDQIAELLPAANREAVEQRARAEAAEAERDAALAEVARLSTPPDDAEVAGLVMKARDGLCTKPKGGPFGPGWSVDLSATVELLNAMADALTRLSHAPAADRKLADDLARALDYARGGIACGAEEALARHAARRKG